MKKYPAHKIGIEDWRQLPEFADKLHPNAEIRDRLTPGNVRFNNATRGARAIGYICDYASKHDRGEPFETVLGDFLADVRHAVDMLGEDWDESERRGENNYSQEVRGMA